ncbi:winged helix-turn-helix transcriptional regulator [Candidatus Shapirobacteria bacterium]|nr:winged helix-turn-helix transcriptional regulator [Candidatus Shapirobacteria bacterium]
MEDEIKKVLENNGVVFVIGLPESGRSYQMRELGKKNNWLVVDIPSEVEPVLDNYEGTVVVNSLDSITNEKRMMIWRKLVTFYHQNPNKIKFVFGQGCEEVVGVKELLGNFYLYYQVNRVWFDINGKYRPIEGRKEMDGVVEATFEMLWGCLSETSQTQLMDLMRGKPKGFGEYLTKTGLVNNGRVFSPLFEEWLRNKLGECLNRIEAKDGKLWLNGNIDLETDLSFQEYQVLDELFKNKSTMVTRNQIAEILWSKDTEEKYSDWAIDQIMSKIRKKIGDVGEKRMIRTVKGQGFVFGQE